MTTNGNQELFNRALHLIPGGVNSPVRAFGSVGGTPRFIKKAKGSRIHDEDGKEYIDFVGSWGPMILGHAHPDILDAIMKTAVNGTSFGAPTAAEVEIAELIVDMVPSAEMARLTSSGTEATMSALRLARGITGRSRFIKFEGCYHGHGDSFLVAAGSGAATHGHPSSPGVPEATANLTLVAPFNDLTAVESLMTAHGDDVAAIFVEPIAGNMGCVPPVPGFLEGLRALCDKHGAMLVFDEVMTGFRVSPNCAQGLLGVKPDLTTLGKIVGGGMPMGVVCGPRELMENFSPTGAVYQAGTLSGNPLSVAAGIALLTKLREDSSSIYSTLDQRGQQLHESWKSALDSQQIPHSWHRVGSMFGLFFTDKTVTNFKEAATADEDLFKRFFHGMLEQGIAIAPSSYEAGFISLAHSEADIAITAEAINALEL
ncbi:MAG: glutamate-1-semialdehyde 2,1-aminomutase [Planctomycetota bacterium]|nr:glutamate-1-semialdehyde 2,1-aminomutase [Planctomycetota bacterium]MDG2084243.1 glutamate-1-semialdehyde 2,1-aminomutase [Planctomycetota bacterium]